MSEDDKAKFEARLMLAQRVAHARWDEQKRIGEQIEILLYGAQTPEACEVLVSVAQYIFQGNWR